ncbi:MAG: isocitrate/isopropylmalate family dehydrogenase [Patescibacteria group bacterium]
MNPTAKKNITIGFHDGEGASKELLLGAYSVCKILQKKYPEIVLKKVPFLYDGYSKMNPIAKKIFDNIKKEKGAVISGAISGDNTYNLRASYKFIYKLIEIKPYSNLKDISPLKTTLRNKIDWLLIRHNKGIFTIAKEKWIKKNQKAEWSAIYELDELKTLAKISFEYATKRRKKLTLTVKSKKQSKVINIWKTAFIQMSKKYPDVELTILNPDFAGANAFEYPEKYDVFFMPDIIGDTLADIYAALLNGNRNFDGSGNFSLDNFSYYNTLHGAAEDIKNRNIANPAGTISNLALMFKYSFDRVDIYKIINKTLNTTFSKYRCFDSISNNKGTLGTKEFYDKYITELIKYLSRKN